MPIICNLRYMVNNLANYSVFHVAIAKYIFTRTENVLQLLMMVYQWYQQQAMNKFHKNHKLIF